MEKLIQANSARQDRAKGVRQWTVKDFLDALKKAGVYRAFILYEQGQFQLSHPALLKPLQSFCELSQDFAQHEGIFIGREDGVDALFWTFVHDTRRGLSQGGLRFHAYDTVADVLTDGMRLSQGMTRKNALAGLHWGGGKGIMTLPSEYKHPSAFAQGPDRTACFEAYGRFVASLSGVYYTAEDVGTNTPDMSAIQSQNRFTTCIPSTHGGSGNPSPFTARGVLRAMEAAWLAMTGNPSLMGAKVAVQGTGNVGSPLIRYLDDLGAEVYVTDINPEALAALKAERPRLHLVHPPESIFDLEADIFAPCAIGAQVNVDTIPRLKVKLVCGAANNILKEPEADAERLRERGIGFVPDFVCNRMGIVNCADEWQGYLPEDVRLAAERVFPDTLRVFKYARNRYTTTTQAAIDLADMAASELHPMLGHRGQRIIDHLVQSRWAEYQPQSRAADDANTSTPVEPAFVPTLDEPTLRVRWEREGRYQSESKYRLAATPISTASSPDLGAFLSAVLLDIKARAMHQLNHHNPQRVLGVEHGGLALQVAVEQNQPYEREELGRTEFVSLCRDYYHRNDADIRQQLDQLGVGIDHALWISPMEGVGRRAVQKAYDFLKRSDRLFTMDTIAYHCPRCASIRVASDVVRQHSPFQEAYRWHAQTTEGHALAPEILFPEFLLGTVALGVSPTGAYAHLAGQEVLHPLLSGQRLPVISSELCEEPVEVICPLSHKRHEKIAQAHQLQQRVQIFDKSGQMAQGDFVGQSRETARKNIVKTMGEQLEKFAGQGHLETPFCGRCESRVVPRYDEQVFVKAQDAQQELIRLIENDRVHFSHPVWKTRALEVLAEQNLWCISRQYWWGNPIPDIKHQVLSTWFTQAIWSLVGAGWPQNPKPPMIEEVFTDAEMLVRWIIPSQLASLIITGQPAFRHIHVHGTLHITERALKPREQAPLSAPDEDRFLFHQVRRPMRHRLGNVIEPQALIRRFGADTVRLAYALSLDSHSPEIMLFSGDRLRQARRLLHKLSAKVTGLFNLMRSPEQEIALRPLDHWVLCQTEDLANNSIPLYKDNQISTLAENMVQACEQLIQYINTVISHRREDGDFGAARATVYALLQRMHQAYAPLCPFVFEKLQDWVGQRLSDTERETTADQSVCALIVAALEEPESMEPYDETLESDIPELRRFFGKIWLLEK